MEIFETISALRSWRRTLDGSLGLVPTMGYLHDGHRALMRRARSENDAVAVSIFANPLQFGRSEDFDRYPRDLPRDLDLLRREGIDAVFTPSAGEMYSDGFATSVEVGGIADQLEGAARPGHFRGVSTVVTKLFNIVQPDRAYFGQKDAQQVAVVTKLVADLNLPLTIVPVPTVRDVDGLALSSRNVYLSPEERAIARAIPRALRSAITCVRQGERDGNRLRQAVNAVLRDAGITRVDYVSLNDAATLQPVETVERPALLSLAVWVGQTRLIDNVVLGDPASEATLA